MQSGEYDFFLLNMTQIITEVDPAMVYKEIAWKLVDKGIWLQKNDSKQRKTSKKVSLLCASNN